MSKRNSGKKKSGEKNGAVEVPAIMDGDKAIETLPEEPRETLQALFRRISNPKKRRWLAAVARCGRVTESQRLTGIDMRFHYFWLEKDRDGVYREAYEKARTIACDAAEDEVWRRAFTGIERPLSYKGKLTGHKIREYSDLLAMFMLKGERPAKYREDSKLQININTPPAVNFVLPATAVTDVTEESEEDQATGLLILKPEKS